jgi:hypothetical protein
MAYLQRKNRQNVIKNAVFALKNIRLANKRIVNNNYKNIQSIENQSFKKSEFGQFFPNCWPVRR